MKLKLLLLGSAAAFVAAQPARAADFVEAAEPIDYVKICDVFGSGYFYIPGTDTCLKLSGYLRNDITYDERREEDLGEHYDFKIRARLNIDAKSETDLGTLQGFMRLQTDSNSGSWIMERAYITLGNWFAGYDNSFYDYSGGDGGFTLERRGFRSDTVIDHIGYRYAPKTGLGVFVSLEDSRTSPGYYWPDLVAGITYAASSFDVKFSAVAADDWSGYAVQGAVTIKLDSIAKNDAIRIVAAMADNASQLFTGVGGSRGFVSSSFVGDSWSILGSFRHYWKPEFVTAITGTYGEANGESGWEGIVSANYSPAKGLWMGPELSYLSDDNGTAADFDRWLAMFRILREF
jgi:hypothetical protein